MPGTSDPDAAFRLNLEQQRKRAKDLLRAVRAGDAAVCRRLADAVALPVPDAVTISSPMHSLRSPVSSGLRRGVTSEPM